jgi:RNA-splicing ligase RtcB
MLKDWHKPPADWNNARRGVGAEKKQWMPNPHRTGGWFVLRDEAIKRMIHPDEMANYALRNRWMFIEHVAGELMGLFGDEVRRKAEERIEFTL